MATTHWATDGTVGVDLESTQSSANAALYGHKHALGTVVNGNNSSRWMYTYASAAVTQYMTVSVEASGTNSPLSVTTGRLGHEIGIAQVAFDAGDYGWVALEGQSLRVATTAAVAVGVALFTAASTPGRVDDQAVSTQAQIAGLRLIATASGTTASSAACIAHNLVIVDPAHII
jgi:hypothetical protein